MPYEKASLMAFVKPTRLDLIHATMSLTGSRKSMKTASGNAVGSARVRANRTARTTAAAATAATILRWRFVSPARRKRGSIHSPARSVRRSSTMARITIASPAWNAAPTFTDCSARRTSTPETGRPDERGDHDHREGHHDRLVDPDADRPAGERQLDLGQRLPAGRAERFRGLHRRAWARPGCPSAVMRIAGGIA